MGCGGTFDGGQNNNSQRHCFKAAAEGTNQQKGPISVTEFKVNRTTQKSAINHQQFLKKIKQGKCAREKENGGVDIKDRPMPP